MLKKIGPLLLLAVLGLIFFTPLVLHPNQLLYSDHSDVLAEHLPAKRFLVRSVWETGEIPLWCPYVFCGSPFVHDVQVGIFYPPHLVLYLVGEEGVGVALSWLIVAHVILAGWGMYAYARTQQLGEAASFVAAMGYMFAGKWLLHLLGGGHYIVVGLAWLPLVTLCLEQAIRKGSFFWATAAGTLFGVLALGTQPQWTFYSGIFLGLWTLGTALETVGVWQPLPVDQPRPKWLSRQRLFPLLRWLGFGAWTASLAGGLAAIQFLPTLEAAGQSMRSVGVDAGDLLGGGIRSLLFFVGPALSVTPDTTFMQWEDRGGFSLLWVAAAVLAPLLCRGKVRFQAGVAGLLILFAFGGCILFQRLPGFSFFRQHARMLMIVAFPVAVLTGVTMQTLLNSGLSSEQAKLGRRVLVRVVAVVAILAGGFAIRLWLTGESVRFHPYWATLLVTVPAAFWLLTARPTVWPWVVVALLLIDLWGLTWPLVQVKPEAEIYPRSACVEFLREHAAEGRVLDIDAPGTATTTPLGTGAPLAMLDRIEAVRGYSPLDNLRFKEYLQFITGKDEPLRPLTPGQPLTFPVLSGFLGEEKIANPDLLDLLRVKYLLQPSEVPLAEPKQWEKVFEDPSPAAFDFVLGGVRSMPSYTVYANRRCCPRTYVASWAYSLPEREKVLENLKGTKCDHNVALEGYDLDSWYDKFNGGGTTEVLESLPNRVRVSVEIKGLRGYLVLTDPWYPGWTAFIDGQPVKLYRAKYLFRAVVVPGGKHEVTFRFLPDSYLQGRFVTALAVGLVLGVALTGLFLWFLSLWKRRPVTA